MAVERGYEQQVAPGRTAGLPQASPDSFGAGVGAGIAQLGGALERARDVERDVAANEEHATSSVALEEMKGAHEAYDRAVKAGEIVKPDGFKPGAADILTDLDQRSEALLSGVKDKRVRQNLTLRLAAYRGDARARAEGWEVGARAVVFKNGADDYFTALGSRTARRAAAGDLDALGDAEHDADEFVAGLANATPDQKTAILREKKADLQDEVGRALALSNPAQAKALAASGHLDGIGAERIAHINRMADGTTTVIKARENAERAQAERAAAAAVRERQEQARNNNAAITAKISNGIVPSDGEISRARQEAADAGLDPADQINLAATAVKMDINRRYARSDSDQLRRVRDAHSGQSESEQVARAHLDGLIDKADSAEAEEIRTLAGKGATGMVQALGQIKGSADRRYSVAEKLGKGLGYVAGLDVAARKSTLEGKEILTARPREFGSDQQVQAALDRQIGPLKASVGGMYDDIRENAHQILAVLRNRKGAVGFDAADMAQAVRWATGASTRRDGTMQGGIGRVRGKPVILPDFQTAEEFEVAMLRSDFSGAFHADRVPAGNGAAVMASTRPEWVGDDEAGIPFYRFVDASGAPLRHANGQEFRKRSRRPR